jgi:hypothetical protein
MNHEEGNSMPETPPVEPRPRAVQPDPTSRLAQLHAAYADAKAAVDAAGDALKAITDAIKVELTSVDPNERRFELVPAHGVTAVPLRLTYTESWRLDSTRMKKEDPETYVRYAKKSGSWRLAPAKGGESE